MMVHLVRRYIYISGGRIFFFFWDHGVLGKCVVLELYTRTNYIQVYIVYTKRN